MANQSQVISSLPLEANSMSNTKFVVSQTWANGMTNTYLLTIANAFSFVPGPYANDATANTNGVGVKSIYYDATGVLRIRLT